MARVLACSFASLLTAATTSAGVDAAPAVPEGLVPPTRKNEVALRYPEVLAELEDPPAGEVLVRVRIGEDGVPGELEIVRGVHPDVDAAVLEAVAGLRYEPATLHGQPIAIVTTLPIAVAPPERASTDAAPDVPTTSSASTDAAPQPVATLEGVVLKAGERTPIAAATVIVAPPGEPPAWTRETETDEGGRFVLEDLPAGTVRVVVIAVGHERRELEETLEAGQALAVRYFTAPEAVPTFRTVVESEGNRREEIGRRTLTAADVRSLPGNQGDPLRAVQILPGVARPPFGMGLLIVRGSAPTDTAILVGDHVITFLFHFGALSTALPPELIDTIEFIPGNFDARYGNHLGGVVRVVPRKGRRDGFHGHADVDLLDAGLHLEGPIGKGSFIVAVRRSIVDVVVPRVVPSDANLQFARAPRYYDYQALLDYPIGDGELTVRIFGADDRVIFVQPNANEDEVDVRDRTSATGYFHRTDLEYRVTRERFRFQLTPSYRYERADVTSSDDFGFDIERHNLSARAELGHRLAKRVDMALGVEGIVSWHGMRAEAPANFDFGSGEGGPSGASADVRTDDHGVKAYAAFYATTTLGYGTRVRVVPGVRATWYDRPMDRWVVDPRLRAAFDLTSHTTLRAGLGLYSQEPAITQQSRVFGNPDLRAERALHSTVELAETLPHGMSLTLAVFEKELWDRVAMSREQIVQDGRVVPLRDANTQRGRVYGAELVFEKKPSTVPVVGWLSYTLLWSRLRDAPGQPEYDADFVQRHVLNAVLGTQLPKRWRVGGRFQLTSGAPYTPVVGAVFDAATGEYVAIDGARNSRRLPVFHQLSIRVEKAWLWNWGSATAYLDVQNIYNRASVEGQAYGFDYRNYVGIGGLPIVPWLGVRMDF